MERAASVFLRADINANDARNMIDWLHNEKVMKYLNEDVRAAEGIRYLLENSCEHLLTCHFNNAGRFFMVDGEDRDPVGFVKLKELTNKTFEIVVAIGDEQIWGNGCGTCAVRQAICKAFFEWRADRIVANIHQQNRRSIRVFEKNGFCALRSGENTVRYELTAERFLKRA